jgi:hypothetical protein
MYVNQLGHNPIRVVIYMYPKFAVLLAKGETEHEVPPRLFPKDEPCFHIKCPSGTLRRRIMARGQLSNNKYVAPL